MALLEVVSKRSGFTSACLETLKLSKQLGRGGFATVLSGSLKRENGESLACAVKLLHDAYSADDAVELRLFKEEAQLMLQLDHGNIITAYGLLKLQPQFPGLTGFTQPAYALVLELMEGGSLANVIVKQLLAGPSPKYTFSQALSWCLDVARALQYLHAGGRDGFPRIHRDVKLENVLLTDGGKVAKLADFGLQRAIFTEQQTDAPVLVRRSQRPASALPLSPGGTTPGPSRMAPDFAERNSQRTASMTAAGAAKTTGAMLSGGGGLESPSSRLGRVGSAASAGSGRASVEANGAGLFSAPVESTFFAIDDKGLLPLNLPPPCEPADPYDPDGDSAVRGPMLGPAERVREALELARRSHSMPQVMLEPLDRGEVDGAAAAAAAASVAGDDGEAEASDLLARLGAAGGSRPKSGRATLSRSGEEGEAGASGGNGAGGVGPSRLAAMVGGAGAGAVGGGTGRPISGGSRTVGGGVLASPRGVGLLAGGAGAAVLTRPSPLGSGGSQVSVRTGAKAGPAIQTQRSGNSISESLARINASSLALSPHGAAATVAAAASGLGAAMTTAATPAAAAPVSGSGPGPALGLGPGPTAAMAPGGQVATAVSLGAVGLVSNAGVSGIVVSGAGVGSALLSGTVPPEGRSSVASCRDILLDATGGMGGVSGSTRNTTGGGGIDAGAMLAPSPSGAASLAARALSPRQTSPTTAPAGDGVPGAGSRSSRRLLPLPTAGEDASAATRDPAAASAVDPAAAGDGLLSIGQRQLLPGSMKHVDSSETTHVGDGSVHSGNAHAAEPAQKPHDAAAAAAAAAFAPGSSAAGAGAAGTRASEDASHARDLELALTSNGAEFSTAAGLATDGGTAAARGTGVGTTGTGTVSNTSAPASALTTHKSVGGGSRAAPANVAQLLLNGGSAGGGGGSTEAQSAPLAPLQMTELLHMRLGAVNVSVRSVRASGSGMMLPLSQRAMGSAPSSPRLAVAAAAAARAGIAPPPAAAGAAAGAARAASVSGATRSRRSSATGLRGKPQAEFDEVFSLTGRTGSLVYLAPEAYKNEPYNDKVDVYSLAILMYELFGRTSITYTHISTKLPAFSRMLCNPDEFAERVAAGYRPPRPKAMDKLPPELWELIEAGWHQDPVQRPDIDTVVEALEDLAEPLAEAEAGSGRGWGFKKKAATAAGGGEGAKGAVGARGAAAPASQGCSCVIC